ncbi:MAG: cytochrome b [Deltaproteobacteria bacterium GWB2_55_19]|nr:MAG: cytochrome b [Deltaproteobacteria bacterium GWB2_55_19]HAO93583.1 cytochrome b [Deltaproteobacteria bacterium]
MKDANGGHVGNDRWTWTAIFLHWVVATLIVANFALGEYMGDLAVSPMKLRLYSYHKWLGVTVFALTIIRLAWRAFHAPPPFPAGMPSWERFAAKAAHALLYALIFIIPLAGWLGSSAHGFQTIYLGVIPIPDLLAKNNELSELLEEVHEQLNHALLLLVIAHAGAAMKHHFIDKDDILRRMIGLKGRK